MSIRAIGSIANFILLLGSLCFFIKGGVNIYIAMAVLWIAIYLKPVNER